MANAGSWKSLIAKSKNGKNQNNSSLLLSASTLETLEELKFDSMTPVQAATIPLFLSNKDVAVEVY